MTWTSDELARRERAEAGLTVVCDRHQGHDDALKAWAEERGLLVYVGRRDPWGRWPGSDWANPFSPKRHGRDRACELFAQHLAGRADLLARIGELRGKVLACWCHPERCHGDHLAALADAVSDTGR